MRITIATQLMKQTLLILLLVALPASFVEAQCNFAGQTTPAGLGNFFVMDSESVFDPMDPNYELPSGNDFDTNIVGRTAGQAATRRADAFNFINTKYGFDWNSGIQIDANNWVSPDGNMILTYTATDSRFNQRVVYSGGDNVPQSGWVVHEARYTMIVIGPSATFFGTWGGAGGELVPQGTTVADGEFLFDTVVPCLPNGTQSGLIHLRYQTDDPFVPDFQNRAAVEYDITTVSGISSPLGQAVGRIELNYLTGGLLQTRVKTIFKF